MTVYAANFLRFLPARRSQLIRPPPRTHFCVSAFQRFAPDPDHRGMEEVYARAEKLILELEETLR